MARLAWYGIVLLVYLSLLSGSTTAQSITDGGPTLETGSVVTLDLKTTLEKGLRARRPSEFEFIAVVVARVEDGTLPLSVVKSTFGWSRKKIRYPMVYFEQAMRVRAKRLGVELDPVL
jgi:hypothetical protein